YQHLSSNGYRQQSALRKDAVSWDAVMRRNNRSELSAHFFYGDMTYQTPGALTITEYNADASQSRPATGPIPAAIDAKATIYQKLFLSGFTYKHFIAQHWTNSTTAYGYYAQMYNPNLRNYSRTAEPNFGGRTVFKYKAPIGKTIVQWVTGAEAQQGFTVNRTYNNIGGNPGSLQAEQDINNRQAFIFSQLSWQISRWIFTAAASLNQLKVDLSTPATAIYTEQERTFNNQIAPRVAILYKISPSLSGYATVEKGFSAPTVSELAPTGSQVNFNLNPEQGWNYEIGIRGYTLNQRLLFDLSAYYFSLTNTIVQRRDSAAGDYYINAGSTGQSGLELYLNYILFRSQAHLVKSFNAWFSYTAADYRYVQFNQLGNDYSGNKLPGIAPNTISIGMNLELKNGVYLSISNYYSDLIPLNDANSEYAKTYNLLDAKLGYENIFRKYQLDLFIGANNIMNEKYSLGNDINAAGGRYYNAAAPVNYYAGITLGFIQGK
ncbi:MAG: TonB-dependent receptor domain-containing protein, partial [Flavipsychrobacter sp.]